MKDPAARHEFRKNPGFRGISIVILLQKAMRRWYETNRENLFVRPAGSCTDPDLRSAGSLASELDHRTAPAA